MCPSATAVWRRRRRRARSHRALASRLGFPRYLSSIARSTLDRHRSALDRRVANSPGRPRAPRPRLDASAKRARRGRISGRPGSRPKPAYTRAATAAARAGCRRVDGARTTTRKRARVRRRARRRRRRTCGAEATSGDRARATKMGARKGAAGGHRAFCTRRYS